MSENLIELSEEQFDEQYSLIANHLNPSAGWVIGEGSGSLFETYGPELEYINRQPLNRIWTLIEGDDSELYIVSGFHFVNRLGYFLSRETFPEKTLIQVHIPTQTDEEV